MDIYSAIQSGLRVHWTETVTSYVSIGWLSQLRPRMNLKNINKSGAIHKRGDGRQLGLAALGRLVVERVHAAAPNEVATASLIHLEDRRNISNTNEL